MFAEWLCVFYSLAYFCPVLLFFLPHLLKIFQGPPGWGGGNNGWGGPPPPFMGRQGPPQGRYDQGRYDQGRHESPQGRYDGGNWIPGGGPPSHGPRGFGVPPPSAGGKMPSSFIPLGSVPDPWNFGVPGPADPCLWLVDSDPDPGSGSGSWIRILLFSLLTFKMPAKKKIFNTIFSAYYFLKVHLHYFLKIKSQKEPQNSKNQGFSYYFCMMIEGSGSRAGSGSGSIPLTSGSGSGRPNNMWIRIRIRIRNTAFAGCVVDPHWFQCGSEYGSGSR